MLKVLCCAAAMPLMAMGVVASGAVMACTAMAVGAGTAAACAANMCCASRGKQAREPREAQAGAPDQPGPASASA